MLRDGNSGVTSSAVKSSAQTEEKQQGGSNMEKKIDWLVYKINDEMVTKKEIKNIITDIVKFEADKLKKEMEEIVRAEKDSWRREMEDMRKMLGNLHNNVVVDSCISNVSYANALQKNKKKAEAMIVVKPADDDVAASGNINKNDNLNNVKRNINVKELGVGITSIKEKNNGTVVVKCNGIEIVSPEKQLLVALWHFATPDSYRSIIQRFNIRCISEIENKEKDVLIDVLGVVTHVNDLQSLVQRSTGQALLKRDITIVDDSGTQVDLTLWGQQAEDFDGSATPIIAVKGARVSEYNGERTLFLNTSSVLVKNPDLPEAHRLRTWYTTVGHLETANAVSRAGGSDDFNAPLYTFEEMTAARLGETCTLSDSVAVVAIVDMFRTENAIYKTCPVTGCRKKLRDTSAGIFRCDKCNKDSSTFKYRLLLNMNLSDATGSRWVIAFGETAEKIIGRSAQEFGEMQENANDAYMQVFDEMLFKKFLFTIRVTADIFQDELRQKYVCTSIAPVTYKTYVAHLINKVSRRVRHHYPEDMDVD
ncbi:replication protein A 70 kDa DNA-binding subunit-like [Temnothorax longispinosus]|uniref:replication protein A 70 kDa DNA-binding subunit-like n=1 Tax=Temnothorax longispinosus TaxID=300112 RepID=UPI003A999FAE